MKTDTAELTFTRELPLTPDRLWPVLTDAAMRDRWSAPSESEVMITEATDVREGGIDRQRCGPKEAPEFVVETRWYRLAPPSALIFTELLEVGGERISVSLVTYRLTEAAVGTELSITVAISSFVGPEMFDEYSSGWQGGLNNLERLASELSAPAA